MNHNALGMAGWKKILCKTPPTMNSRYQPPVRDWERLNKRRRALAGILSFGPARVRALTRQEWRTRFCAKCGTPVAAHPAPVLQREEAPRPAEVQQPKYGLPKAASAPQSNNKQPTAEKHGKKRKTGMSCVSS
jgi:hypothetical protein